MVIKNNKHGKRVGQKAGEDNQEPHIPSPISKNEKWGDQCGGACNLAPQERHRGVAYF